MGWMAGGGSLPSRLVPHKLDCPIVEDTITNLLALEWNVWSQFVVRQRRGISSIFDYRLVNSSLG